MKSHLFFLVSVFFFASVGWAAAATPGDVSSPVPPPDIFSEILSRPPDGAQPQAPLPNTMNCFDHYRFGSVQADFSAVLAQALPGTEMTFSGTIQNNNPYPIVDGSVYVKIFRVVDEDESLTHRDGYPVVDQFSLPQSFHIPAQGKRAASFQWLIPANAPGGEYFAAFYFQSAKRYNLLGLSFTDDVTGNQAPFRVTHPNAPEKVSVNKHTVTLNGSGHSFVGFPRHFSRGEAVTATVDIENPKSESTAVMIDWNLYAWDGLREETLSGTETQIVELKAGEKKTVSYTVPPASTSVSYLVFQMHDGFSNSFLNIRFVRDDVPETRINFPSIESYPLEAGQEASLFSCVHSTNMPLVRSNVLTLTLKDEQNQIIHAYTYRGDVTGAMMGVADTFRPTKDYANFSLTAKLERDGILIEEVVQQYRCQDIDPNLCPKPGIVGAAESLLDDFPKVVGIVLVIALALIGVVMTLLHAWKKRRASLLALLFLVLAGLSQGGTPALAKSVTWNSGVLPDLAHYRSSAIVDSAWKMNMTTPEDFIFNDGSGWRLNIVGAIASITYKAQLINVADGGSVVADGASVPVGTRLRVDALARASRDISWNGTGYSGDSPYGYWVNNAGPRTDVGCSAGDFVGVDSRFPIVSAYNLLNVHPTTPERSAVSGNLSCDGTGICTVTGPGALTLGVDYPATYGKFYHRHTQETVLGLVCRGHNIPLRETIDGFSFYFGGVPFGACDGMNCLPGPAYQLDIPAQSINFNVTAFQPNSAPSAPTIVGTGGNIGESLSFSATATDADGDQVHYLFDWNNDGVGDVWSPVWSNLVDSGTASTSSYTWWSSGSQTFQVEAYDSYGNASGWSTHTITIVANVTGQCGVSNNVSFSAAPGSGLCLSGTETAVLGSGPWSWSCTGSGAGTTADCQAFVIPTVSLMANPLVVDYGSPTTLTWSTSHTASCSASATGASWSGDQALNNGVGEAVIPNASPATYTLSCSNAEGATASASVVITMYDKLKICEDSCNSTLDRTGQTFGVEQGANKNLKACFNPYPGCAQALGDVTGTAAWADTNVPDDAFSFTGSGEVHPLPFNRTENFTVTYGGVTKAATAQVICIPNACSIDAAKTVTNTYCPDIAQDTRVPSGCDGETLICPGTRHCDYNVREVAP